MKTSELTGALLDLWVAKAEGICLHDAPHSKSCGNWGTDYTCTRCNEDASRRPNVGSWHPSTDWAQGGPIIDAADIGIRSHPTGGFIADLWLGLPSSRAKLCIGVGPTRLVAAMRAYVASKFGDEVPDEATSGGSDV